LGRAAADDCVVLLMEMVVLLGEPTAGVVSVATRPPPRPDDSNR
jgi:hypothetical protein